MSEKTSVHGAVLVNLTIRQFGNEKTDQTIVKEVAERHNASFSRDRYLKQCLPPAVLGKIKNQISAIRSYHYRVTSPWFDRGIRMMASAFIIPYQAEITRLEDQLKDYINEVADSLKQYEAEARRTRGTLFESGDIPSRQEFIEAYEVDIELLPVPMKGDFRIDYISNKEKTKLEKNNEIRFAHQTQHLIDLVMDPLYRLKKSMSNLERSPKIHTTTIETLDWWCDNIGELLVNRTHATQFAEVAAEIKSQVTAGFNPEGRPKYDPHAIEGALKCIDNVEKRFKCISI